MADGYRGVFGAVPYAIRSSDSWIFRSYALVSALAAALVTLLVVSGVVVLIARTSAARGGLLTLSRSFYMVVGLFIVAPTLAPTLLVARRHRREGRGHRSYDAALALVGYLFLLSVYLGLVITVPPAQQTPPTGALAPLIAFLYGLPQLAGLVPPLVGALLIVAVHRALGRR